MAFNTQELVLVKKMLDVYGLKVVDSKRVSNIFHQHKGISVFGSRVRPMYNFVPANIFVKCCASLKRTSCVLCSCHIHPNSTSYMWRQSEKQWYWLNLFQYIRPRGSQPWRKTQEVYLVKIMINFYVFDSYSILSEQWQDSVNVHDALKVTYNIGGSGTHINEACCIPSVTGVANKSTWRLKCVLWHARTIQALWWVPRR